MSVYFFFQIVIFKFLKFKTKLKFREKNTKKNKMDTKIRVLYFPEDQQPYLKQMNMEDVKSYKAKYPLNNTDFTVWTHINENISGKRNKYAEYLLDEIYQNIEVDCGDVFMIATDNTNKIVNFPLDIANLAIKCFSMRSQL
jgi:hypothetical protein